MRKIGMANPDHRFAVRVQLRDHIGTSAMSRLSSTYAPVPNLANAIHIGTMTLFAHDIEYSTYEPYGKRVNTGVQFKGDPRYTDHEFDDFTGFNTMKGRFQFPAYGKFNRPDPMRDWDWTSPTTINLYQYASNDPVNRWDPFGFDDFTDDPVSRAYFYAMFRSVGFGSEEEERGAFVSGSKGRYKFDVWPRTSQNLKARAPRQHKEGEWNVHTHPNEALPQPSPPPLNDYDIAEKTGKPIYTIHRMGLYKYDPVTKAVTQEADSKWVGTVDDNVADKVYNFLEARDDVEKKASKYRKAVAKGKPKKIAKALKKLNKAVEAKDKASIDLAQAIEKLRETIDNPAD